jgi:HEAT repeat protein/energy-coupling factor transporter ATP-binding protein EcfA2
MLKSKGCNLSNLLNAYRDYLRSKVSKVRILGERGERDLRDVFLELNIADQHRAQRATILGMMDSAMRRRFNPFADTDGERYVGPLEEPETEAARRLMPDELLRPRTRAIITGAPGSGKTTLLKYLALQALEKEERLVVWLELKAIDKPLIAQAEIVSGQHGALVIEQLWLWHIKAQLALNEAETELLRKYWQEKFKANEIVVLLDGFDELRNGEIEHALNKCVREFASALHDNILLISTRPYAQHKLGKEHLQELEIEPLNGQQIEAFLLCYYPFDAAVMELMTYLRERSSFRDLLHVPLLLGVILRLYKENRFTGDRLNLYETIIFDLVHDLDRSKSVLRQFQINDVRLRLDFLKFLAFERLLRDPLDEKQHEGSRLVFDYDLLKEKAGKFLRKEHLSYNPRDLADDALATSLLQEIGANNFSFAHLTLQEYLAARIFAAFHERNEVEALRVFCRAYHNPTIVEMEILPMVLGAIADADKLYAEIEGWPDSLTFANLRLRARGLSYGAKISQLRLVHHADSLFDLIIDKNYEYNILQEPVIRSFRGANQIITADFVAKITAHLDQSENEYASSAQTLRLLGVLDEEEVKLIEVDGPKATFTPIEQRVQRLLDNLKGQDRAAKIDAAWFLGKTKSQSAIEPLIEVLQDEDIEVRKGAIHSLGQIGSEIGVEQVARNLQDEDVHVRWEAALSLERIGSTLAIDSLLHALKTEEDHHVRQVIISALGAIGSDAVVDGLIHALKDRSAPARAEACRSLGDLRAEKAIVPLKAALKDKEWIVRRDAVRALGQIGSDLVIDSLIESLRDIYHLVRQEAAEALGELGPKKAIVPLLALLKEVDGLTKFNATKSLAQLLDVETANELKDALYDIDRFVQRKAAKIIGYYSENPQILKVLSDVAENDPNKYIREVAREAAEKYERKLEILGYLTREGSSEPSSDNKSLEQVLIGEVYKIVGEAGHLFRLQTEHDYGVDGEIEFKDEHGKASGKRVYLQLKSGDSYLHLRKRDGKEIFTIRNLHHAEYWQSHPSPVLLVIRTSNGIIRWMNVTEYLERRGKESTQIEFQGVPFTAESIKQMGAKLTI